MKYPHTYEICIWWKDVSSLSEQQLPVTVTYRSLRQVVVSEEKSGDFFLRTRVAMKLFSDFLNLHVHLVTWK